MCVAVAMIGSAAIGGITSYMASKNAADAQQSAASQAAATTAASSDASIAAQERMTDKSIASQEKLAREGIAFQAGTFDISRADLAPWRTAGANALTGLQSKMAGGPPQVAPFNFETSPGYQFRLDEGQKAVERGAAARGNLLSGATGKALTRYGQDYATNEYQTQLGNYERQRGNTLAEYYQSLTPYQSLAGVGQTTAGQMASQAGNQGSSTANILANLGASTGSAYSNLGANMGQTYTNAGNSIAQSQMYGGEAQAGGYINQANSITGALGSIPNAALAYKLLG
jgi:hypothetical protein